MKTLSTEQQVELQDLFNSLKSNNLDIQVLAQLTYWANEMRPKRVRRNPVELEESSEMMAIND